MSQLFPPHLHTGHAHSTFHSPADGGSTCGSTCGCRSVAFKNKVCCVFSSFFLSNKVCIPKKSAEIPINSSDLWIRLKNHIWVPKQSQLWFELSLCLIKKGSAGTCLNRESSLLRNSFVACSGLKPNTSPVISCRTERRFIQTKCPPLWMTQDGEGMCDLNRRNTCTSAGLLFAVHLSVKSL